MSRHVRLPPAILALTGLIILFLGGQCIADSGRDIYESHCGACHGLEGKPILPNVPNFAEGERMNKSDTELLSAILLGKGFLMPSWEGVLTEQDCKIVLQFIRNQYEHWRKTAGSGN